MTKLGTGWENFGDTVDSPTNNPNRYRCSVRDFIESLPDNGRAAIEAATANPAYTSSSIHRAIVSKARELDIGGVPGQTTFARHRKGDCQCAKVLR